MQPPVDRDSTRVLAMPGTGRFQVVFARDANGNRPESIVVSSLNIAQTMAGEYKGRLVIVEFLNWLWKLSPKPAPIPAWKLWLGKSGVRARPGSKR